MQINRLFEIIYMLINKKSITAKELSEHFEVSQRTIYRDIDTLCECGIPIYTTKGKGGGISLIDNFVLNKSLLSADEQTEILTALQSLQAADYNDNTSVLCKLSGLFGNKNDNWLKVDFSSWCPGSKSNFNDVKYSILNNKIINFDYYNSYGQKTTRSVEPIQLWFKDKNWYLKAFCLLKNTPRIFKLTRMRNLKVTEETFKNRFFPNDILENNKTSNPNLIHLKLKIDCSLAFRVYDEFDYNYITRNNDNSFTVDVSYPDGEWVYSYILSFGKYAKVIEPEYIKKIISERIKAMYKMYL